LFRSEEDNAQRHSLLHFVPETAMSSVAVGKSPVKHINGYARQPWIADITEKVI
jgi:hypothetical protein